MQNSRNQVHQHFIVANHGATAYRAAASLYAAACHTRRQSAPGPGLPALPAAPAQQRQPLSLRARTNAEQPSPWVKPRGVLHITIMSSRANRLRANCTVSDYLLKMVFNTIEVIHVPARVQLPLDVLHRARIWPKMWLFSTVTSSCASPSVHTDRRAPPTLEIAACSTHCGLTFLPVPVKLLALLDFCGHVPGLRPASVLPRLEAATLAGWSTQPVG